MSLGDKSLRKLRKEVAKRKIKNQEDYDRMEQEVLAKFYEKAEAGDISKVHIVAGKVKNFSIEVPKTARTLTSRVKTTIFDILSTDILKKRVLDLFAGAGAFGLEALSRGAKKCVFVDSSKFAQYAIEKNIQKTGFVLESTFIKEKVQDYLDQNINDPETVFEIIFLDPPYKLFNTKDIMGIENVINGAKYFLPYKKEKNNDFKGVIIVKHPRKYPIEKLNISEMEIFEKKDFGINSVTFFIVKTNKK